MPLPYKRSLPLVVGVEIHAWHFVDDATSGQMVRKYYDQADRLRCIEYPETHDWDLFHHRADGQILTWEDSRSNWKHYHYDTVGEQIGFATNGDWWKLTDVDNKVYYCEELKRYSCPSSGFEGDFNALLVFLGLNAVVDKLTACTGTPDDPLVLTEPEHTVALKSWKSFFHVGLYLRSLLQKVID